MSRHENTNQFKDGLLMDLHPLQTPNTVLTDCLNGTFITYNGNEYSLQNDMGNFKLKNCRLSPGYLPIGSASYADTIYLLSYNPIEDKIELGSYPSPAQYNDSSDTKYHQIYGLLEGFVASNQKENNTINSDYTITQSDLKEFIKSITFDGKQFRLKSGDEYLLKVSGANCCMFESFDYEVIFDSGKKQKFDPPTSELEKTVPVPWDTPGNIKITNHLFEFNQSSSRITSKRNFKDKVEIDVLYEVFIIDPKFNDIISDDILEKNIRVVGKFILPGEESIIRNGFIKRKGVKQWLDTYKKIEYLFTFEIPASNSNSELIFPDSVNITITPEFITDLTIVENKSKLKNITNDSTINFTIIQNEHIANLNIDLENIKVSEIGDSKFYWKNQKLYVNCTNIDGYTPYYKIHDSDSEEWQRVTSSSDNDELIIDVSSNEFVAISFCYREEIDINPGNEENYEEIDGKWVKKQYDLETTKVVFTYDSNIMDELWNEYCGKILSNGNAENDSLTYGKRYDLISFVDIYKKHLNNLNVNYTLELGELGTIHDFNAEQGEFYKYFNRFFEKDENGKLKYEFPSIVSKAPQSYNSDQCFEIPRDAALNVKLSGDIESFDDVTSDNVKSNITIKYIDRKDLLSRTPQTINKNTNTTVQLWNKIKGEVSQLGDTFYFVDNLKYEAINGSDNYRFDAVTLDQDGNKNGDFTVNCEIDGQEYLWKSLDIQNYRAIRMGYPQTSHHIGEEVPCRQMDFAGFGEKGINNMSNLSIAIGGAAGLGAAFGLVGVGAVGLAASITALASLQSFDKRKLSGMCNYIGNFHKLIRNNSLQSDDCALTTCKATTFYRDKAQRPSFTTSNGTIHLTPDWKKWKDGEGDGKTKHHSKSKTFLTLPILHTKGYKWGPKRELTDPATTMEMTEDYELWVKISGSEQHSTPVKKGGAKSFEHGVGFINIDHNPGWYKVWTEDWDKDPENQKNYFQPCSQTSVTPYNWMSKNGEIPNWCGQLFLEVKIPDSIYNKFEEYRTKFLNVTFENFPTKQTFEYKHESVWRNWESPDSYFTNIKKHCDDDYENLTTHPIFKCFIKAGSRVSDRIKNWPVAGMYPLVEHDVAGDVFDSVVVNNMPPWENIYVDGSGKPYLTRLDPESHMYICKNGKKQVFGYFPCVNI